MLIEAVTDRLSNVDGRFGIDYIDLRNGKELFFGNTHIFPGSGAIMIMPLVECFRAMDAGEISEKAVFPLKKASFPKETDESYGVLRYMHEGIRITLSDLYNLVATVSDNMAFNMMVDILGIDRINLTFKSMGYGDMKLNRKINDYALMKKGVQNYISVKDMAAIFLRMYKGQLISEQVSGRLISLLKQHQRTNAIPYVFEENTSISHITGYDEDIIIDGGIVFTEEPFILVMAAQDMDARKAQMVMRDITQICKIARGI